MRLLQLLVVVLAVLAVTEGAQWEKRMRAEVHALSQELAAAQEQLRSADDGENTDDISVGEDDTATTTTTTTTTTNDDEDEDIQVGQGGALEDDEENLHDDEDIFVKEDDDADTSDDDDEDDDDDDDDADSDMEESQEINAEAGDAEIIADAAADIEEGQNLLMSSSSSSPDEFDQVLSSLDLDEDVDEDDSAPIIPKQPEKAREPHHIPTALGNPECAECQHDRYLRCFRQQAENAVSKTEDSFPTCDRDAQQRCQLACWDKLVAVDGIRDAVWKNEDFCSMCRNFQGGMCKNKFSEEEAGQEGVEQCDDKAHDTCTNAGWCNGSEK